jgi:hypothetical protein
MRSFVRCWNEKHIHMDIPRMTGGRVGADVIYRFINNATSWTSTTLH